MCHRILSIVAAVTLLVACEVGNERVVVFLWSDYYTVDSVEVAPEDLRQELAKLDPERTEIVFLLPTFDQLPSSLKFGIEAAQAAGHRNVRISTNFEVSNEIKRIDAPGT